MWFLLKMTFFKALGKKNEILQKWANKDTYITFPLNTLYSNLHYTFDSSCEIQQMDMVSALSMRKTQRSGGLHFEKQSVILCEQFWLLKKGCLTLQLWETSVGVVDPYHLEKLYAKSDQHPEFNCTSENVGWISTLSHSNRQITAFWLPEFSLSNKKGECPLLNHSWRNLSKIVLLKHPDNSSPLQSVHVSNLVPNAWMPCSREDPKGTHKII